jgi:hypothetical protein
MELENEIQSDLMQCYFMSHVIAVGVETASEMNPKYFIEVPLDPEWLSPGADPDIRDHQFILTMKGLWIAKKLVKQYGLKDHVDWREWQGRVLGTW